MDGIGYRVREPSIAPNNPDVTLKTPSHSPLLPLLAIDIIATSAPRHLFFHRLISFVFRKYSPPISSPFHHPTLDLY